MKFDDLPEWLTGTEVVTWAASKDADVTSDVATRRRWLSARDTAQSRAFNTFDVAYDPSRSDPERNPHPEPMTAAERADVKGRPEAWGSWWVWLRIYLEDSEGRVSAATEDLTAALRRGGRRGLTAQIEGANVDRREWLKHHLVEIDPCQIEVRAAAGRSALHGREITVRRDDVLKLWPAPDMRRPSDDDIYQWMMCDRDRLRAEGSPHGRNVLISRAHEHYKVATKIVRQVWDARSTSPRKNQ